MGRLARDLSAIGALVLGGALAGCSAGATSPYPQTQVNPLAGTLQLAVGTANIFGDDPLTGVSPALPGAFGPAGLNVVESFRQIKGGQAPGDSDSGVTTPTLSGPFTLPATQGIADGNGATLETGPGPSDAGTGTMNGTAQPNPGTPNISPSTFGVSTNASGWGLEPFNFTVVNGAGAGSPISYTPFNQPLFDSVVLGGNADPFAFTPWGGPPAYDPAGTGIGVRNATNPPPGGVVGVSLGLDTFANVAPVAAIYTLSVVVPTGPTTTGTKTATASLHNTALLPAISPPTVIPDGAGGASVTLTLPAGVTEALALIVDIGPDNLPTGGINCNSAPAYYTVFFNASGTIALSNAHGPGTTGHPTHTLCTAADNTTANKGTSVDADSFVVQSIGFDYPFYEASYPQSNGNPAPTIVGANGQADITISSAAGCVSPGGATTPTCASTAAAIAEPNSVVGRYLQRLRVQATQSRFRATSPIRR
ncbi:MAG: hypothetical protein ACREM8_00050 [Vulcanimicrobiaceae bacterium]